MLNMLRLSNIATFYIYAMMMEEIILCSAHRSAIILSLIRPPCIRLPCIFTVTDAVTVEHNRQKKLLQ